MNATPSPGLTESAPSVQTHLGILQSVIQRMAANSASCKAWCITLVSAILVIVGDKDNPDLAWLALIPAFLFLALDSYYLGLEKGFRQSYSEFVDKLHGAGVVPADLYSVLPAGSQSAHQLAALRSFSVWGFYSTLVVLIVLARNLIIEHPEG